LAKLILPLGSFGARGKIGDAFVFFPWKGLNCVREYVIPANPNSSAQQTQRGYFTSAVNEYHAAAYNELDQSAFRLFAAQSKNPLTYFNVVIREHVNVLIAGDAWASLYQGVLSLVGTSGFTFEVDCSADRTAVLYYGLSPGYMPTTDAGSYAGTTWTYGITGLSSNTKYYFYVKNTASGYGGRTGIYTQITAP